MQNYVLFTDSGSDIPRETLEKWGVGSCDLTFVFDDSDTVYTSETMPPREFYKKMRDGHTVKTSAVNVDVFLEAFEKVLKEGKDILYLALSTALSGTYSAGCVAAKELCEKYPERRITVIDSLCGSAGLGLLVYMTAKKRDEGADLDAAADFAEKTKLTIGHWFTVDDLVYLRRGGRISPTAAVVGGLLGIKPVLHMDDEGHLVSFSKARGRKKAIQMLCNKYGELALSPKENPAIITHGDCESEAVELKKMLVEKYDANVILVEYHGATTGAHAGPGVIALFYPAKNR